MTDHPMPPHVRARIERRLERVGRRLLELERKGAPEAPTGPEPGAGGPEGPEPREGPQTGPREP